VEQPDMWDAGASPGRALPPWEHTAQTLAERRGFSVGWTTGAARGTASSNGQETMAGQELGTPGDESHQHLEVQAPAQSSSQGMCSHQ